MYATDKVVYKYILPLSDGQEHKVRMPIGAQIIHVGTQGENICIWALVTPLPEEHVERNFFIVGTGDVFDYTPAFMPHVWSVQMVQYEHEFVWHIFERIDPDATRRGTEDARHRSGN